PNSCGIWMAIDPSPPDPPHTRTTSPFATVCGGHARSIRYALAPTSVGAAACSPVRSGAFGRHSCACTFVSSANEPQLLSKPQSVNEGSNIGSFPAFTNDESSSHIPQWITTSSPIFTFVTAEPTLYTIPEASEPPMWKPVVSPSRSRALITLTGTPR